MPAKVINGVEVASAIRENCRKRIERLAAQYGITPGLAVILVAVDSPSHLYVRNKVRACDEIGIRSFRFDFQTNTDPTIVIDKIEELNADPSIHGILVQLPLPPQFKLASVLNTISADKDVDGFHLHNVGALVTGDTLLPPCTPYGVVKLFEHESIELGGKNVVVVGASNIVGKPMALMLMQRDATVCVCHAKTRNLAQFTLLADILIVAAGHPNLILRRWCAPVPS